MQLRVCKLRQLKIYISDVTYFSLVKKYQKLASIKYFKVRLCLQKAQICNEKSMKMAHRKTWILSTAILTWYIRASKFFSSFCFQIPLSCRWSTMIVCLYLFITSMKTHFLIILENFGQIFYKLSTLPHKLLFFEQFIVFFQNVVCLLCSWKKLSQFMFYDTWTIYW